MSKPARATISARHGLAKLALVLTAIVFCVQALVVLPATGALTVLTQSLNTTVANTASQATIEPFAPRDIVLTHTGDNDGAASGQEGPWYTWITIEQPQNLPKIDGWLAEDVPDRAPAQEAATVGDPCFDESAVLSEMELLACPIGREVTAPLDAAQELPEGPALEAAEPATQRL